MNDKIIAQLVDVNIQIGEYEKQTSTLILCSDENEAMKRALLAEAHCSVDDGAMFLSDNQLEDCYGEMIYTVDKVKEVTESEFEVLKKFMYFY
tara:strand:+ start:450 stop:728 length:279 start_codon:yes stop_codon:yes gene_type:complete